MTDKGPVTLFAVGDVMLGEEACSVRHGVGTSIAKQGPLFPFERCATFLRDGDIVTGNMEAVLSAFDRVRDPFDRIFLRGQPEAAEGLASAGFNVMTLANNHIMQHGRKALEEAIHVLGKHNISVIGIDLPDLGVRNRCVLERKGVKVGLLGYNFRPQQYFVDARNDVAGDMNRIRHDIEEIKGEANVVVVSVHWGEEFINHPTPDQVRLGREIIDSGADLVLGHHPHILQGVEEYGKGVIAYSLGNFVFDMWQVRLRESMILKCRLSKDGLVDYDIIPALINASWQPEILVGSEGEALREKIRGWSAQVERSITDRPGYYAEVRENLKRFRKELYWHILTHAHKFGVRRLCGNLLRNVRNRLRKRPAKPNIQGESPGTYA